MNSMNKIKKMATFSITVMFILVIGLSGCTREKKLDALIITGQNNHNWKESSVALKSILEKSAIFSVDVSTSPEKGEDMSGYLVDFTPYDLVVLDYNGDEWPEKTKNNFVNFVKSGGGVVLYHAADNSFPDWKEYNEIIGLGGWKNRNEDWGPYVYIKNGEVVRDSTPGRAGGHGAQREYIVEAFKPGHPVLKGLPAKWRHARDELYAHLRGPAKNMEILAYARSKKTGRNEPVLMTIAYGKGRIFHSVLGHSGKRGPFPALECAGFITTLQRGAEWAATGKVEQKAPHAFPTEDHSLRWAFYEDIHSDFTPIAQRMQNYQTGKSYDCFNILKILIRENMNNAKKINVYHEHILHLLESDKSTVDCKKILLKEFSWAATEDYRPVYEQLKLDPDLALEAQYALDRMNFTNN